jgi:hypothetical protein
VLAVAIIVAVLVLHVARLAVARVQAFQPPRFQRVDQTTWADPPYPLDPRIELLVRRLIQSWSSPRFVVGRRLLVVHLFLQSQTSSGRSRPREGRPVSRTVARLPSTNGTLFLLDVEVPPQRQPGVGTGLPGSPTGVPCCAPSWPRFVTCRVGHLGLGPGGQIDRPDIPVTDERNRGAVW